MTDILRDRCLIIAEAGVNHNGDINLAYRLCDAAKDAGADVVKFQTYVTDRMITSDVAQAEYQARNTGKSESQYDMLKRLELSYDDFRKIKEYCDKIGIVFASTPDDPIDLKHLISMGIPFIKIGSGDIDNIPLLRSAGESGLPVILSTGMSSPEDIDRAIEIIEENGSRDITLLHCTTSYPCPNEDVNLRAMLTLADRYGREVGYSDHTCGIMIPVAAVAMGAKVIEKHLTLDKNMEGPDHKASTEPDEFRDMVTAIKEMEAALGDGRKTPTDGERSIKKAVTKRIVAAVEIKEGEIFSEQNLAVKRSMSGLSASDWDKVLGHRAGKDYVTGQGI